MVRFMTASFVALGWAFYEMSGGAGFAPPEAVPAPRLVAAEPAGARLLIGSAEAAPAPAPVTPRGMAVVTGPSEFGLGEPPAPAAVAAVAPAAERRTVAGSRVNMRAGPGTDHGVVDVLSRGETTTILTLEEGWARVRSDSGREGWMALSLLAEAG